MNEEPMLDVYKSEVLGISNPQQISINDITMNLLNADIFADMEATMVIKPKGTSSQDSVIQSLLEQHSMYPIFPSPTAEFPIEYKYEEEFSMNAIPDIMCVQSTAPCFAKVFIIIVWHRILKMKC